MWVLFIKFGFEKSISKSFYLIKSSEWKYSKIKRALQVDFNKSIESKMIGWVKIDKLSKKLMKKRYEQFNDWKQ